ncbi:arsenate reductase ArsC [Thiohalophilus sp.]|uniref:arsenate reductase ArsC n=1 Tax=Thiohalophilus sp. TaxID=3028392 RepID=UPI002ACE617A|nr:arsenate reductase ArsC [Thiohalophilus sp.]MDZ7663324.1 arsenate reductase ArsC [Thiohalophilus sp.]
MNNPVRVLFVCDGGSARSRMAEGLLRAAGDEFEPCSAGIEAEAVPSEAGEVMNEIGIDIGTEPTPALNDFEEKQFDYVIALCDEANTACLSFSRDAHNLHWTCPDPTLMQGGREQQLAAWRAARDALKRQIDNWLAEVRQ